MHLKGQRLRAHGIIPGTVARYHAYPLYWMAVFLEQGGHPDKLPLPQQKIDPCRYAGIVGKGASCGYDGREGFCYPSLEVN